MSLSIHVRRTDRSYKCDEVIKGYVEVDCRSSELSHGGLWLKFSGVLQPEQSNKNVGLFEAFYKSLSPKQLMLCEAELKPPGKFPLASQTKVPFEIPLQDAQMNAGNPQFFESFHGVFIKISYQIKVSLLRKSGFTGALSSKTISTSLELRIIQSSPKPGLPVATEKPAVFEITPSVKPSVTEMTLADSPHIPDYLMTLGLNSVSCLLDKGLQGTVNINKCDAVIKSVELQLVRVETCGVAEGYAREKTEIQNIQIGQGNVRRGRTIPFLILFPRTFTCPTVTNADTFRIEFEVNLVVVLESNHLIVYPVPLTLHRF